MKCTGIITLSIFILISQLCSCSKKDATANRFTKVEILMDENPDSALTVLNGLRHDKSTWGKAEQMRYELLYAKAQNKAYLDFTTDSIMLEVAAYYDAHGSANEQMEAHYLLGCAYRDLKESPMALSCYLDATEKVDTLSEDCDYGTLMRIWGQIANEFDNQVMPYKELEAFRHYESLALKNNDSLSYALGVERECNVYSLLADTAKIISRTLQACKLFEGLGRYSQSKFVLSTLLPIYIDKGELDMADSIIDSFEETDYFDSNGDIIRGKEYYYESKAKYYESVDRLDSAEFYYRKLSNYGYEYDAYKGLLSVFNKRKQSDSIFKYSTLKERAFNKEFTNFHTQAMFNADGMFNYARNQRIAMEQKVEAERALTRLILLGVSTLVLIIISLILFYKYKARKKKELERISALYHQKEHEYQKALEDYSLMENDFEEYKAKKAEEMERLQESKELASAVYERTYRCETLSALCSNEVIQEILQNEKIGHNHHSEITDEQWEKVYKLFEEELPKLYNNYITRLQLSDRERKTLVLTCLGINTKNIAVLLNMTSSNISNIKASINQKLFFDPSAKSLYNNIVNL